jgi:hypothetical protein
MKGAEHFIMKKVELSCPHLVCKRCHESESLLYFQTVGAPEDILKKTCYSNE